MSQSKKWIDATRAANASILRRSIAFTHSSFALIGLLGALFAVALIAHPHMRHQGENQLRAWLQERHIAVTGITPSPEAIDRATAANPKELPSDQAAVAYWISKKYRVAAEPIAAIVAEAYELGAQQKIDPTLILAVMAVESSFNPYAQSSVGAQGLMQVMTRVHTEKYESFGGNHAAFDPVSNLRVGTAILKEYLQQAGSVEGALKYYVGAANLASDGGYGAKVLAEHRRLRSIAGASTPHTIVKPMIVAKRQITPTHNEAQQVEAVAASSVKDDSQVTLNSNL